MTVPERSAHFRHEAVTHPFEFRRHDDDVKLAVIALCALVFAAAAQASDVEVAVLSPAEDVSLPFWCDWGYDWDERCYREDGPRLAVGGEVDKVWRSAVSFSTAAIPPGATISTAELSVWYDGRCLGPRKTTRRCDGRGYDFAAHPIFPSVVRRARGRDRAAPRDGRSAAVRLAALAGVRHHRSRCRVGLRHDFEQRLAAQARRRAGRLRHERPALPKFQLRQRVAPTETHGLVPGRLRWGRLGAHRQGGLAAANAGSRARSERRPSHRASRSRRS
jgi:hypothetical protein